MDLYAHISTFVRVVELGSFSAVASEQNSSQPAISRQIANLEKHLNILLLRRTTRALHLTEAGQAFYTQAQDLQEKLIETMSSVGQLQQAPVGTLRVGCAVVFGRLHLIPHLPAFFAQYPKIKVELLMNDGYADLIGENMDLAIRIGDVTDPNLIARKIGKTKRMVVASPEYLAIHGMPHTPQDLINHQCIVYTRLATGAQWRFEQAGKTIGQTIGGNCVVNNTEGVRSAVLAGLGIAFLPEWHFVENEVQSGKLVRLLDDYLPAPQDISVVYASKKFMPNKTKALIEFLTQTFAKSEQLRR